MGSSDCFSSIHTFLEKQNLKKTIEQEFRYGHQGPDHIEQYEIDENYKI